LLEKEAYLLTANIIEEGAAPKLCHLLPEHDLLI
jgi:hypothetical protein